MACVRCQTYRLHCSLADRPTEPTTSRLGNTNSQSPQTHSQPQAQDYHYASNPANTPASGGDGHQAAHASPRAASGVSFGQPEGSLELGYDLSSVKEMVNWYFRVIHDKHHSLFHQPTFERDLDRGCVPSVILYAVIALGARQETPLIRASGRIMLTKWSRFADSLFPDQDRRHRGRHYAEQAFRSLDLRDLSLTTVQACILLGTLCFTEGQNKSEAAYYAAANRMAVLMEMPYRPFQNEVDRQINLRGKTVRPSTRSHSLTKTLTVWWSLYMIDIWCSSGLRLGRQLFFDKTLPLPAEETYFLHLVTTNVLPPPARETGIWTEMCRLAQVWAEIQDVNRDSVAGKLDTGQLYQAVQRLSNSLDAWQASLPPFLVNVPVNRAHYLANGLGTSFAAMHLGYHYYGEVLFYQFLAAAHQQTGISSVQAREYADRCAQHALSFCDILYECDAATDGQECMYIMLGHMLVVTSTIYMHMLLFNRSSYDPYPTTIRERLERNFTILTKLQQYWATLESSLLRLKIFHNACLRSIDGSFSMDRWMLQFILEYGVSMPDRFGGDQTPSQGLSSTTRSPSTGSTTLQAWYYETFTE